MNVHGVGPQQQGWQVKTNRQETQGKAESAATTSQFTLEPPTASAPAKPVVTENQEKGVIRLLQEEHFQGVADVRLRINFHEELQQAASQEAGAAWASNTQAFTASLITEVNTAMAGFANDGATDPLLQSFAEATAPLFNGVTDGPFDLTAAIAGLTEAFSDLISGLEALDPTKTGTTSVVVNTETTPSEDAASATESQPEAADATPAVTTTAEPNSGNEPATATFAEAIAKLQQWFDQEMAEVQTTIEGLLQPPEPGAPRGNGVAYERFLATYHSLYTMGNETETDSGSTMEGVQTEA